jgi:hypothetical protein
MPIQINLPDNLFSADETAKLKNLFGTATDEEFSEALGKVTCAALTEYRDMFLGMGLPSRADEIRQHRLFHLIKKYFPQRLPSEAEVSAMFQLPQAQSRSLIRYVMTRFHYDLEAEVRNTLRAVIKSAQQSGDSYQVVIQSDNVVEELNRIIGIKAPKCDPITKVKNMARTYTIAPDSNEVLREYLGFPKLNK